MPGPSNRELGNRSPFRWRVGTEFETWRGVNKEKDAAAIDNTQWQHASNARIAGGEIGSRGGQEAILSSGLDGCVYGMIDVEGAAEFLVGFQTKDAVSLLDSISDTTSFISLQFAFDTDSVQRLMKFQGRLYVGTDDGLQEIVLDGRASDDNLELIPRGDVILEDFNSYTLRNENGIDVAYIGTHTGGIVYRWDGTVLTQEATGIGSGKLFMASGLGEVYAASTNSFIARGTAATWNTSYAMPGGIGTFVPIPNGSEFLNTVLVAGNDPSVVVLSFNGTALSVNLNLSADNKNASALYVADGLAFLSYEFNDGTNSDESLLDYWDGSVWTNADTTLCDATGAQPGFIISSSPDRIYWGARDGATGTLGDGSPVIRRNVNFRTTPTVWTNIEDGGIDNTAIPGPFAVILP